jgi:hypothetical protein
MSAKLLRLFSLPMLMFLMGTFFLYQGQFDFFANDPGVGWHLASGKYILQNKVVPFEDPFLAFKVRPWISDQWLSDVIYYLGFSSGGWSAIYNFTALVFCLTFFAILLPWIYRFNSSWIASTIGVFFAFKISQIHFILRPVVFGFPFFAVTFLAALSWYRSGSSSRPWYLLGIFFIWANIHPSFILGLLIIGLIIFAQFLDYFLSQTSSTISGRELWCRLKPGVLLLGACLIVTLINPYGVELHKSIFQLGQSDFFMNLNEEWMSPNFDEASGKLFLIFSGMLLLPFLLGARPAWRSGEFILIFVFLYFTLKAVRFFPYVGIVYAPFVAEALLSLGATGVIRNYRSLSLLRDGFSRLDARQGFSAGLVALTLLVISVWGAVNHRILLFNKDLGPSKSKYPYEAVAFLRSSVPTGQSVSLLASPDWGGFITLEGQGIIKPVVDDRNTLLGESFYKDFLEAAKTSSGWINFAHKVQADYFIISAKSPMRCEVEKQGLKIVFEDSNNILVEMKDSRE